ncbi:MAG TPA: ABC transporter ATP-binding protein [Candidatus Kapabacteria bacterium]|nr:ABC transporter ATP-binding protein [Candidatus Kapabacteria bacterium]
MKSPARSVLSFYWQHVKLYKKSGILLILCVITGSILTIIIPLYYKDFFDVISTSDTPGAARGTLITILTTIAILHLFEWILWRTAGFANNYFKPRVNKALAETCFRYLHKHSFSFFHSNFVGSLVKRVSKFLDSFERIADNVYWFLLKLVVNITVILIVLFSRHLLLGTIVVVWIILFLFVNWILSNFKFRYDIRLTGAETRVTGILADTVTNHSNVKLFNGYHRECGRFSRSMEDVRYLRSFTWNLDTIFEGIQAALMIGLELVIYYFAIGYWQRGLVTIGDFVLIQAYLLTIFGQVWDFGRTLRFMYHNIAEAQEMAEILQTPHEIIDVHNAKDLEVTDGKIEFKNVVFYYHSTRRIISNMNLTIQPKEKVALVGTSGSGKSTLVKLLLRQHEVSDGKILIDGQRISHVTQESLWKNISLVPQEPILFHRSILENIRYSKPDATDEEVIEAARLAHCDEFIREFPEKYQTEVGERGVKLSGGERQRIAIARAILRNAPILILDEATSSLDSESEQLIQEALDNLMKGKTVIVIAHRLSTIMIMDKIVVIDKGNILEEGTHNELLQKKGMYYKLWQFQAGGFVGPEEEEERSGEEDISESLQPHPET